MSDPIILAHRGWWRDPADKNSRAAILRAFDAGYGVETDVRDHNGDLVLAHDPPSGAGLTPFEWVIESFAKAGQPGALAINVKADGLHRPLADMLAQYSIANAFVFDMAVPDALGYLRLGVPAFTRHSEIEPVPAFYGRAQGVWIDCFESDWVNGAVITAHVAAGKKVALVSPELHGRPNESVWEVWRAVSEPYMICTDFPDLWCNR
jgi:hypothetical protein